MGTIHIPPPVKLIIGFIAQEKGLFLELEKILKRKFGPIDFKSQELSFIHTQYYEEEFGDNLSKNFISFEKLIDRKKLAFIKIYTNDLESKFSKKGRRRINIDPGYLTDSKLVLATTKNYSHRIYLEKGIFAETTLFYKDRQFNPWPWTYPDYKSEEYLKILGHIRSLYMKQLKLSK